MINLTYEQQQVIELKDWVEALPHNSLAMKQYLGMKSDTELFRTENKRLNDLAEYLGARIKENLEKLILLEERMKRISQ